MFPRGPTFIFFYCIFFFIFFFFFNDTATTEIYTLSLHDALPICPDLDLCFRAYLHRFDIEHTYRFAKHGLGWAGSALREPGQVSRWTWLIIAAITQLRLARAIAEDRRLPWERPRKPGRLTPGRVRRDFARLLTLTGTPASPPKPSNAGPGRPKGRTSTPAPRHPVLKKAA